MQFVSPIVLVVLAVICEIPWALLLSSPIAAQASTASEKLFIIRALGDRCVDVVSDRRDEPGVVIKKCNTGPTQTFRVVEIDASHDFHLQVPALSMCVGLAGDVKEGQRLTLQPCVPGANAQRFAFDGDALLVGTQSQGQRVARDFVLEPFEANTNENTPVVVGERNASDAEYWRMIATDGSNARPTTAFVAVHSEFDLLFAIALGDWGTVIELEPGPATAIELQYLEAFVLKEGMTLRGARKFIEHGAGLRVPTHRIMPSGSFILALGDQARVTGLHLEGNTTAEDGLHVTGIAIYNDSDFAPNEIRAAFIDHVDVSRFSTAIQVSGGRHNLEPCWAIDPDTGLPPSPCWNEDDFHACPPAEWFNKEPFAKVIGNFIHHNPDGYGVSVGAGGDVLASGNLLFLHRHDVTSDFTGFNRYIVRDSLFTSQRNKYSETILDVHGSCSRCGAHWRGGVAGGSFEVAFNSFLTYPDPDDPTVGIRGTPCEHFSFRDNLSVRKEDGSFAIEKHPWTEEDYEDNDESHCLSQPICAMTNGEPCVPGNDADILKVAANNQFDVPNPTSICLDPSQTCSSGDFGVGDFDGDSVDDLFLGTGVGWWFSAGGKTEWRFLNQMPEHASDLRFGDFDGDGRTDVIALHDKKIEVSWAGGSRWFPLNTTEELVTIADLAVGQFDADPRADLFVANGEKWTWSSAGTGPWDFFAFSSYRTPSLRFGDFTADGRTDVFGIVEDAWRIVPAPGQYWTSLGPARTDNITEIVVADFNGDGRADVGRYDRTIWGVFGSDSWKVSWGGTSDFDKLIETEQLLTTLPIGRFDDVPGADVLLWRDGLWLSIASGGHNVHPWSWQSMR
jgi:hypothetical protein